MVISPGPVTLWTWERLEWLRCTKLSGDLTVSASLSSTCMRQTRPSFSPRRKRFSKSIQSFFTLLGTSRWASVHYRVPNGCAATNRLVRRQLAHLPWSQDVFAANIVLLAAMHNTPAGRSFSTWCIEKSDWKNPPWGEFTSSVAVPVS